MDGQQNVLDGVFHVVWIAVPPRRERTQVGHDVLQKLVIGGSVAILGAGHENAPINLSDDWLSLSCVAPISPYELQRRRVAARLLGHRQQAPRCSAWARMSVPLCRSKREIGRASCRKECRSRWSPYH